MPEDRLPEDYVLIVRGTTRTLREGRGTNVGYALEQLFAGGPINREMLAANGIRHLEWEIDQEQGDE